MLREEFENDALVSRKRYIVRQKSEDWSLADLDAPKMEKEESVAPEYQEVPDSLSEEQLVESIFELADTWCPSINEAEYVEFLQILNQKMNYMDANN